MFSFSRADPDLDILLEKSPAKKTGVFVET